MLRRHTEKQWATRSWWPCVGAESLHICQSSCCWWSSGWTVWWECKFTVFIGSPCWPLKVSWRRSQVSHRWWRTQSRVVVAILKSPTYSQDNDKEHRLTSCLRRGTKKNIIIFTLFGSCNLNSLCLRCIEGGTSDNVCVLQISTCVPEVKITFLFMSLQ